MPISSSSLPIRLSKSHFYITIVSYKIFNWIFFEMLTHVIGCKYMRFCLIYTVHDFCFRFSVKRYSASKIHNGSTFCSRSPPNKHVCLPCLLSVFSTFVRESVSSCLFSANAVNFFALSTVSSYSFQFLPHFIQPFLNVGV